MRAFRLLSNLERKIFINQVKNIITNPKRILMYIIYGIFMTWVVYTNVKNVGNSNSDSLVMFTKYYQGGAFLLITFMAYALMKQSSIAFRMSEINLLFTAPVDSRKILLFSLFKRIPIYLLTSVYTLIFILSLVISMFSPSTLEIIITGVGYTLIFLILEPLSFSLFVISTKLKKERLANQGVKAFFFIVISLVGLSIVLSVVNDEFSAKTVFDGLNTMWLNYIPILGWGRYLTSTAVIGIQSFTWVAMGLMLVTYIGFVILTYKLGDDYYEDVIQTSEERNQKIREVREGKSNIRGFQLKKKNVSHKKFKKGAGAFNWKRELNLKRTDFSIYFSMETLLCLAIAIGAIIFIKDDTKGYSLYAATGMYFYMKFLFSMETQLDQELKKPFYYLIPDTAISKVINVIKIDIIRFFINVVLLAAVNMVFKGFNIEIILLPIMATMFYLVMTLSSYVFNLFLPSEDFKRLIIMFKMLQMILFIMPSFIVMIIIGVATNIPAYAFLGSILINIIISGIMLGLSEFLFSRLELKG